MTTPASSTHRCLSRFSFESATLFAFLAFTVLPATAQSPLPDAPQPAQSHPSQSAPAQPQPPPTAPVTILEDTQLSVLVNTPVSSRRAKDGAPVLFTVSDDVLIDNVLAIPRGAIVHGEVIKSKKTGVLTGSPELTFKLVSLDLGGRSYPLYTYLFQVKGLSKTKPTERKVVSGAYVGAIAGAFAGSKNGETTSAGHAVNMAAGAAIGAGIGTAVSAASPGPELWIPAEAQLDFYLSSPITVTPVSPKEAARLGQGLHSGGPTLYVRGDTP